MEIGFLLYTSLSYKARKHHLGYISRAVLKKERYYRVPHNYLNSGFEFQPTNAVEKFNYLGDKR